MSNAARKKLARWLDGRPGRASALARALGVSKSAVSRWKHGDDVPGAELWPRIEKATGGACPAALWKGEKDNDVEVIP